MRREACLAIMTATILSVVALARTSAGHGDDWASCLSVAVALFFVVLFAIGLGIGASVLLYRAGCDPAAGAAPLLTTLSDVAGIAFLCLVASAMVPWMQPSRLDE